MLRLGVVSFLNARPLIEGLPEHPGVQCRFDVPAALSRQLHTGLANAALIPVVDVLRSNGHYRVVSDACIGSDGHTMTVRIFSHVPPAEIRTLSVDGDSHTSVCLATVLWHCRHGRRLELRPLGASGAATDTDALLLIGDKVVAPGREGYAHQIDLGAAWRELTGLPFVFAVWACPADTALAHSAADLAHLATLLSEARDRGVRRAAEIAAAEGPRRGWPVATAHTYLTQCMRYTLDEHAIAGANRFARHCAELGLAPPNAALSWAAPLHAQECG
jgi:chorismate dehydratase